tara:strand:- start:450 stop:722 length:273 start_codon:yes stop_codon:yes gene_type:complete
MHAALAGTQFSMSQGPPWSETDECSLTDKACEPRLLDHGDRKTELVCIGQELDHAAAAAALNRCLLSNKEMARGLASWSALPDPFHEVVG